jgi:orotidine-5'-phosphate decarboxylase
VPPQLIIALDVPSSDILPALLRQLPARIAWYKVGLELYTREGPAPLIALTTQGRRVFLDLKLHDIPRTVARAVTAAAHHGAAMLTLHAAGGREMLRAAAEAARAIGPAAPKLVAVTTLTSLNEEDLRQMGVSRPLSEHTLALGAMALACGIDGLVCSPLEAALFRQRLGQSPLLVTPGVRPAGADVADQKRVATPAAAVQAGSNFLVVGRPILEARDPRQAALSIIEQMEAAAASIP